MRFLFLSGDSKGLPLKARIKWRFSHDENERELEDLIRNVLMI